MFHDNPKLVFFVNQIPFFGYFFGILEIMDDILLF